MWPDVVVLSEPLVDDDLCLLCCGEPMDVEHPVAQALLIYFIWDSAAINILFNSSLKYCFSEFY